MTDLGLQGWSGDPFQQHEERYFSAGRPTKLVRDGGRESYDEPPPGKCPMVATDVISIPGPAGSEPPRPTDGGTGYPPQTVRRPRAGPIAAALLLIAGTIAGLILKHGPKPGTEEAASPAAVVTQSVSRTVAEQTARVTISGSVRVPGHVVVLSGNGAFNFAANATDLQLRFVVDGRPATEEEILINGSLYLSFTTGLNGAPVPASGGRTWVRTPLPASDPASSDPLAWLTSMRLQGSMVRALGTKNIGGADCTGYAVTPSLRMLLDGVRKGLSAFGIPSNLTDKDLNQLRGVMAPITFTIWIDAQHMVRELGLNFTFGTTSAALVLDLSDLGAPVRIVAPLTVSPQ